MSEALRVGDRRRRGYFTIDNIVIDRLGGRLGASGLAVYACLCRRGNATDGCFTSYARIAADTGLSRSTVMRRVKDLRRLGLIEVEERWSKDGSEQLPNQYWLLDVHDAVDRLDRGEPVYDAGASLPDPVEAAPDAAPPGVPDSEPVEAAPDAAPAVVPQPEPSEAAPVVPPPDAPRPDPVEAAPDAPLPVVPVPRSSRWGAPVPVPDPPPPPTDAPPDTPEGYGCHSDTGWCHSETGWCQGDTGWCHSDTHKKNTIKNKSRRREKDLLSLSETLELLRDVAWQMESGGWTPRELIDAGRLDADAWAFARRSSMARSSEFRHIDWGRA